MCARGTATLGACLYRPEKPGGRWREPAVAGNNSAGAPKSAGMQGARAYAPLARWRQRSRRKTAGVCQRNIPQSKRKRSPHINNRNMPLYARWRSRSRRKTPGVCQRNIPQSKRKRSPHINNRNNPPSHKKQKSPILGLLSTLAEKNYLRFNNKNTLISKNSKLGNNAPRIGGMLYTRLNGPKI